MTRFSGKEFITEVVRWGQGKVVLYSEDEAIFDQFKNDPEALTARAYKRDGTFLASDIEFPKAYEKTLTRRLKELKI